MIIAGTGHRPNKLGGYGDDVKIKLQKFAVSMINNLKVKPDRIISGMALGWDQALARAAVELGIPFIAAVPFRGQEMAWPASSQKEYAELLTLALKTIYVSEPGYYKQKMQIRNAFMVNSCDIVLALWDGTPGGTKNCLDYATYRAKKMVINVWDEWRNYESRLHQ